jgi:hypothetical protein
VPDPSRSIRVEDQRAWQILRTHYLISEGFALVLLTAPDEWTLSRIRAHLPELLPTGAALRVVGFESTFQPEVLTQEILGRNLPAHAAPQVWVEAPAPSVSSSDPAMEPWHAAFSYLNRHRNDLPREIPGTLVIAGTPETIHALRESAPDLYSIRSTLLAFDPAPSEPGLSDQPAQKRQRLTAYRRALLAAFRPYQELAIDNFAAAEQAAPDIWDIFVHPACSKEHLRPEDMDIAQRETPPRMPAQDLLPLLAQDDYRRTVLLADPGMGKSTLIQSLIAHLASGRGFSGAAALTGLLPVPLILRDIVPLLPQDQVASWSWDGLLNLLIERYQRDEAAPPLCDSFKDHRDEFRHHLHTDAEIFFLIDGLDEIGDLAKRRQIVNCIQDGIRAANKNTRWLITSREIGYDDAPVDELPHFTAPSIPSNKSQEEKMLEQSKWIIQEKLKQQEYWSGYIIANAKEGSLETTFEDSEVPHETNTGRIYERWPGVSLEDFQRLTSILSTKYIAQRLHLAPFDDKRQDLFTQRWFQHRHSTDYSRELMREVRAHHHDGVRIISRVPNLLCMMNILKRSGKPLPDGRAALYDAIVQAYLGGIDAAYRLRPVLGNTCPFDTAQRRFLLALLGAHMQESRVSGEYSARSREFRKLPNAENEGNILISRPELEQLLIPAIQRMREEGRLVSTHTTAEELDELLHHIASRSGLLIPRSSDEEGNTLYGFTHLSFLEFFAAEWLGMEFDRRQRQLARRSEAQLDEIELSKDDLERLFPPHGPIQHTRESFRDLPALPAWHEPLIFLLESRKADTPTLLRWLFPALHSNQPHVVSKDDQNPTPLLPLDAVQFAINIAQDPEIPLPMSTRQSWWRILWSAYLAWPHAPWEMSESTSWRITPLLLGPATDHAEVLKALIEVYPQAQEQPIPRPAPTLYLYACPHLTSQDLLPLRGLERLEKLYLDGCSGLKCLPDLHALQHLKKLYLMGCTGLNGAKALHGLSGLARLEHLDLDGCTGLERLPDLRALQGLKTLDLRGCTGLEPSAVAALRKTLPKECRIIGPDGKDVK